MKYENYVLKLEFPSMSDIDFEKLAESLKAYTETHFGELKKLFSISDPNEKPFDKAELREACENGVSLVSCYAGDTRIKIAPVHNGYEMYVLMQDSLDNYYSAELELFFSSVDDMIANIDRLVGDKGIWSYND